MAGNVIDALPAVDADITLDITIFRGRRDLCHQIADAVIASRTDHKRTCYQAGNSFYR